MTRSNPGGDSPQTPPRVAVSSRRGISIVWIVPLAAALIGAWLAYQSYTQRGVRIEIVFSDAEGLEAGKTKIKYRSLEVGEVRSVRLHQDQRRIVVEAEIKRSFEQHLTVNSKFWVVRPRFGTEGISGLATYLSGTYVGVNPVPGAPSREFEGLDLPEAISRSEDGLKLVLTADNFGSLRVGSPVRTRSIKVGEVESYHLLPEDQGVEIDLFIPKEYEPLVRGNSRFWNASGVEVSLDANGLNLKAESLAAILGGAISFRTPWDDPGDVCRDGTRFRLRGRESDLDEPRITRAVTYLMYFESSVRGLVVGAPVEHQGLQVGRVTSVSLVLDREAAEIRVPVLVELELERMREAVPSEVDDRQILAALVEQGLRGQVQTGNLVAGQMFVGLDFHDDAKPASIVTGGLYPVFPTVESRLDQLEQIAREAFDELRALPLAELADEGQAVLRHFDELVQNPELLATAGNLRETLESIRTLARRVDGKLDALAGGIEQVTRQAGSTLEEAGAFLGQVRNSVRDESPLRFEIDRVLAELSAATRSIRILAETLERNPDSLIFGKQPVGGSK